MVELHRDRIAQGYICPSPLPECGYEQLVEAEKAHADMPLFGSMFSDLLQQSCY